MTTDNKSPETSPIVTLGELIERYPALRPPLIEGILRKGETMNIIANSKVGKSWLINDLAIAVATGQPWLGIFPTVQGSVLIIDNELHPETIAHRLKIVASARGIDVGADDRRISVWPLRGRLLTINGITTILKKRECGEFSLLLFDAFYRVLPSGLDENSNADMASVYNAIDNIALVTGAANGLVHHASKGNQSEKSVTDVGSGAGSISRAADTHLILRRAPGGGSLRPRSSVAILATGNAALSALALSAVGACRGPGPGGVVEAGEGEEERGGGTIRGVDRGAVCQPLPGRADAAEGLDEHRTRGRLFEAKGGAFACVGHTRRLAHSDSREEQRTVPSRTVAHIPPHPPCGNRNVPHGCG